MDPEALVPVTHFSNNQGGLDLLEGMEQEETKGPAPSKSKRRQL